MNTPICDFCRQYADSDTLRLHMPGHKGSPLLGFEALDITEIHGADSLYDADGIISESEANAGMLFGARSFYSTEGSSLSIRAMLHLACQHAKLRGRKPVIVAGRNAHRAFLSAAALLDFEICWLYPADKSSYLSCPIILQELEDALNSENPPTAVYITSPDYLGNTADISAVAKICRRYGTLLLVDNAHGAYLKFLSPSRHPIDLGADMCCDSAHKTLPVLTGGAYLHISNSASDFFADNAKNSLALFGSTSPSYLILQSLDAANSYIADAYREKLGAFTAALQELKSRLVDHGFSLCGTEPLKLSIKTGPYGYKATELSGILSQHGIECEFADRDYLVMMFTPENGAEALARLYEVLLALPRRTPLKDSTPPFCRCEKLLSPREAMLAPCVKLPVDKCEGKILAGPSVACPPAVPIVICGERISAAAIDAFKYYGIDSCTVVADH